MNPIIIIPSRLASTRLANKPLADICGLPMIVQVIHRAKEANFAKVVVAAADKNIAKVVIAHGGEVVLTDPALPSGSDRVYQALRQIDPEGKYDVVINLQGDLPTIEPQAIAECATLLNDKNIDIATLAAIIDNEADKQSPNVVKAIIDLDAEKKQGNALYFTRTTAPWGEGDLWHHIGIYAYQRKALEKFIIAPPSYLEKREKLEQLRALSLGLKITVKLTDIVPIGVDTQEDLDKAITYLKAQQKCLKC